MLIDLYTGKLLPMPSDYFKFVIPLDTIRGDSQDQGKCSIPSECYTDNALNR